MAALSPKSSAGSTAILVGRSHEQQVLGTHLATLLAGHGSAVIIGGEAGVGKTTLVDALATAATAAGALVLRGHCYDLTTTPPYGPWIEAFSDDAVSHDQDSVPAPLITRIAEKSGWDEAVRSKLARLATDRPVVVIQEDIHWADAASLELLRSLARHLSTRPVLLLATYRDDELTRRNPLFQFLPLLLREAGVERLRLARFERAELDAFVAGRFSLSAPDHARLVTYLQQRSGGNALFALELLRGLVDDQRLTSAAAGWQLAEIDPTQVPQVAQQIIELRLVRLDENTQRLLEIAALIGQELSFDLWIAVSGAPEDELADALDQAVATGILATTAGGTRLTFAHALIRETLIQRQILPRRRPWHRRIADVLAAQPQPDPDAIAYHLERAGDPRRREWLIRAGDRAQARFAWPMAVERFEQAQVLYDDAEHAVERAWLLLRIGLLVRNTDFQRSLDTLEDAERLAGIHAQPLLASLALAHQGLVRCHNQEMRLGLRQLERGVRELEQLNERDQAELRRLTDEWTAILGVQGRGTLALKLAEIGRFREAEGLLENWDIHERDRSPDAERAAGVAFAYLGRPERARLAFRRSQATYLERSEPNAAGSDGFHMLLDVQVPFAADHIHERRELSRSIRELWTDPFDPEQSARLTDAIAAVEHVLSGNWTPALAELDAYVAQSPYWISPLHIWRLQLLRLRGETAQVWESIHRALSAGPLTEPGELSYAVLDDLLRLAADMALDADDIASAQRWLAAHDRLLEWSGAVLGKTQNQILWGRYHLRSQDAALALQHAERALEHAGDPRQPLALIAAHRLLGMIATDQRRVADAQAHLQQALDLATSCESPYERAQALLALAALHVSAGAPSAAAPLLDEARAICQALGATPALAQIDLLLARLASDPVPINPLAGLTRREVEVLRLLSAGKSNQEIAAELFISYHTVTTHVANILGKLGVESRTEAATYAVRHGLA